MCEYWGIDLTCVTGTCIDDPDNWEYGYYCDCGSYEASTWSEDGSPTCVSGKSSESVTIHYSSCLQHRCVCLTPFPVYTSECMQHLCAVSALKHLKTTAVFACVHLLEAPFAYASMLNYLEMSRLLLAWETPWMLTAYIQKKY